jgi:beta-glucosidase-like glycosyl hydrolase
VLWVYNLVFLFWVVAAMPQVVATCKHFLGYSLEMSDGDSRFNFNAQLSPQDMVDTYTPAFKACVQQASGQGIMCSYNAVNGTPACANPDILTDLLRKQWGFQGYVVSDCNAVSALTWGHGTARSKQQAAAAAIKAGTDLLCDDANKDVSVGRIQQWGGGCVGTCCMSPPQAVCRLHVQRR